MRYMSHFRAIHRGSFFMEMRTTEVRVLLPDAWGFVCPGNYCKKFAWHQHTALLVSLGVIYGGMFEFYPPASKRGVSEVSNFMKKTYSKGLKSEHLKQNTIPNLNILIFWSGLVLFSNIRNILQNVTRQVYNLFLNFNHNLKSLYGWLPEVF